MINDFADFCLWIYILVDDNRQQQVRLSTEIAQDVVDHVPGIIDEMKKPPISSEE